jgi:GT2 family glycosyltransferase
MKLSICIVHYRQELELERFLESIYDKPPGMEFEVIVVDNSVYGNGSAFGSEKLEILKRRFEEKGNCTFIVSDTNLGYGQGHEVAFSASVGSYVAFCNADLEAGENSFDALLGYMEDHEKAGLVGPKLVYDDGTVQDSYRRFPRLMDHVVKRLGLSGVFKKRMGEYLMWEKDSALTESVDWVVGAVMVLKRGVYKQIGGFDKRFFLFFEDTDLCRKVWERDLEVVYVAESVFFHHHKRLSNKSSSFVKNLFHKAFWSHVVSGLKYFWKWKKQRKR